MPVNPRHTAVAGMLAYPDIASLPIAPDLAVICTPPATVPGLVAEAAAKGARGAIIITAGFGEGAGADGARARQAILDAARPHLLRVIGPNCLGVISTTAGPSSVCNAFQMRVPSLRSLTASGSRA